MKKVCLIFIVISLLVIGGIFLFLRANEDVWIKDSSGVYVEHGNPSEIPDYVLEQQEAITCALEKFEEFAGEINSQCLGTCGDYAVDIVHVPRSEEDNLIENQCEDYNDGKVDHFIELDNNGEIVGIV